MSGCENSQTVIEQNKKIDSVMEENIRLNEEIQKLEEALNTEKEYLDGIVEYHSERILDLEVASSSDRARFSSSKTVPQLIEIPFAEFMVNLKEKNNRAFGSEVVLGITNYSAVDYSGLSVKVVIDDNIFDNIEGESFFVDIKHIIRSGYTYEAVIELPGITVDEIYNMEVEIIPMGFIFKPDNM